MQTVARRLIARREPNSALESANFGRMKYEFSRHLGELDRVLHYNNRLLDNLDFIPSEAVETIDELIDNPVDGFSLSVDDRPVVSGSSRLELLVQLQHGFHLIDDAVAQIQIGGVGDGSVSNGDLNMPSRKRSSHAIIQVLSFE